MRGKRGVNLSSGERTLTSLDAEDRKIKNQQIIERKRMGGGIRNQRRKGPSESARGEDEEVLLYSSFGS